MIYYRDFIFEDEIYHSFWKRKRNISEKKYLSEKDLYK